jgi:hypothetical protein
MEDQIQQEVEQTTEETVEQASVPETPPAPQENANLRSVRLAKEKLERENQELINRLKQIEESKKAQHDPDDLVPRRYVDEQLQEVKKQMHQASTEYKLKVEYPDFDKVVNDATISRLKEKNPALAYAIGQVGDVYSQASAAYEAIKNLGIYTADTFEKDRERAQHNANKPKSLQSINSNNNSAPGSPINHANAFAEGLTEDHKKQLWKEMNHYRNHNTVY